MRTPPLELDYLYLTLGRLKNWHFSLSCFPKFKRNCWVSIGEFILPKAWLFSHIILFLILSLWVCRFTTGSPTELFLTRQPDTRTWLTWID